MIEYSEQEQEDERIYQEGLRELQDQKILMEDIFGGARDYHEYDEREPEEVRDDE